MQIQIQDRELRTDSEDLEDPDYYSLKDPAAKDLVEEIENGRSENSEVNFEGVGIELADEVGVEDQLLLIDRSDHSDLSKFQVEIEDEVEAGIAGDSDKGTAA